MKNILAIKFYPLDSEEILSCTIQNYYWPRSSYLNYFEKPYIPPLKEELHVEVNIVFEDYVEVKEKNIEIFKEINEDLVIEEEPEIKIVEEINKDPCRRQKICQANYKMPHQNLVANSKLMSLN